MIERFSPGDIGLAVGLHIRFMPNSFFARLGYGFLYTLYEGMIESDNYIAYTFVREGKKVGFIMSTLDTGRLFRFIFIRKFLKVLFYSAAGFLRNFRNVYYFIQTFSYFPKTGLPDVPAELLFISIEKEHWGGDIGKELILKTLEEYVKKGVKKVKVTTEADNIRVNALLDKLGFSVARSIDFYGKGMYLHTKDLTV